MSRLSDLDGEYRRAVGRLRRCCDRVDRLHGARRIGVSDCELIYESAFLNAVARFEGLLNDLLQEFVCGVPSTRRGCYALIQVRSRGAFRAVITGGRSYVDLMPYKDCVEISKRFLNEGKPFSEVDQSDRDLLAQAVVVRNAIAHRSDMALERFRRTVPGVSSLIPQRQFPGSFLRKIYRSQPDQRWSGLYLDTLEKVGAQLTSNW